MDGNWRTRITERPRMAGAKGPAFPNGGSIDPGLCIARASGKSTISRKPRHRKSGR